MSTPFLSEIRMFSFNFAPKGWALCNGQFLPINQNQALFALLGTTYGGNGQTNFQLPDLRSRVPVGNGAGFNLGERAGEEFHTITINEMPQHLHFAQASSAAASAGIPTSALVLAKGEFEIYRPPSNLTPMKATSISSIGGSQPHENRQPFLTVSFCIALQGIFPSQN